MTDFPIQTSFWCSVGKLRSLQELVHQTNGYFIDRGTLKGCATMCESQEVYVSLGFESSQDYQDFGDGWCRINRAIRESHAPWWRRLANRMRALIHFKLYRTM